MNPDPETAPPELQQDWMTLREACDELGLSERQIRRRMESEDWQTMTVNIRRGVRRLVRRDDVQRSKEIDGHEWHGKALVRTSDSPTSGQPSSDVLPALQSLTHAIGSLQTLADVKPEISRIAGLLEEVKDQQKQSVATERMAARAFVLEVAVVIIGVVSITTATLWHLGVFDALAK